MLRGGRTGGEKKAGGPHSDLLMEPGSSSGSGQDTRSMDSAGCPIGSKPEQTYCTRPETAVRESERERTTAWKTHRSLSCSMRGRPGSNRFDSVDLAMTPRYLTGAHHSYGGICLHSSL